ncbi:MAG: DUF4340 domain-containing protein [Acidiferrobacterales bacterium]
MRNRWLLNALLLLAVATLTVLLVYRHGSEPVEPRIPLTSLSPDEIMSVHIQYPERELISLRRDRDKWAMLTPRRVPANEHKVRNLLHLASAPSQMQLPAKTASLHKYGLDKPVAHVWLGKEEIKVGVVHPFDDVRYVHYRNMVHVVPGNYFSPESYRDLDLISPRLLGDGQIPVVIELPKFSLRLKQEKWVVEPPDESISADEINTFINRWRLARALFMGGPSREKSDNQVRIVYEEDGKRVRLELGIVRYSPDFVLYRKDASMEYHFTEQTGKRLLNINPVTN